MERSNLSNTFHSSFFISHLLVIIRVALGAVFIYSGWEKLMAPFENFEAVIEGYQFLKPPFIFLVAVSFPWLELIFGAFLALGFLIRTSALALSFLLITFLVLLCRSFWLHLPVSECGCFGSGLSLAPWQAIILDIGLLSMAVLTIWLKPYLLSLDQKLRQ